MEKKQLSWEEVSKRAEKQAHNIIEGGYVKQPIRLYGVPRGGIPAALQVAYHLKCIGWHSVVVETVAECDFVIDDIIDSGKTRNEYEDEFFYALVNKQTE